MLAQAASWLEQAARQHRGKSFADCTRAERQQVIEMAQADPQQQAFMLFIVLVRASLAGFLCDPRWRGNRDRQGWIHIGKERAAS